MAKFLSIPVTDEQNQLVSADDIVLIEQGSTTTVVINYQGGKINTVTHAAAAASNEDMRDYIQDSVILAHQQPWHQVKYQCDALPLAVSGIAIS